MAATASRARPRSCDTRTRELADRQRGPRVVSGRPGGRAGGPGGARGAGLGRLQAGPVRDGDALAGRGRPGGGRQPRHRRHWRRCPSVSSSCSRRSPIFSSGPPPSGCWPAMRSPPSASCAAPCGLSGTSGDIVPPVAVVDVGSNSVRLFLWEGTDDAGPVGPRLTTVTGLRRKAGRDGTIARDALSRLERLRGDLRRDDAGPRASSGGWRSGPARCATRPTVRPSRRSSVTSSACR